MIIMLLCCFGFDGVVAAVVSIAGGSGLVDVLMVGNREGGGENRWVYVVMICMLCER
jgi:hypothetical protein